MPLLNATQIPTSVIDAIVGGEFTEREVKVLLHVCRHAIGYQPELSGSSLSSIAASTGMGRPCVSKAVKTLEAKGAVTRSSGSLLLGSRWGVAEKETRVAEKETPAPVVTVTSESVRTPRTVITNTNTHTHTPPQPAGAEDRAGELVNRMIGAFEHLNPTFRRLYRIKAERDACSRLLATVGAREVASALRGLRERQGERFCPQVHTPCELERKWPKVSKFLSESARITEIKL